MRTISLDLRERILASYDNEEGTRDQVAARFRVSVGMVKKLLQQRRRTGDIAPRHHYSGRKRLILPMHHRQLRALLGKKPDLTLKELRVALELPCTLPAIHYALVALGLTYKKRHCWLALRLRGLAPLRRPGPGVSDLSHTQPMNNQNHARVSQQLIPTGEQSDCRCASRRRKAFRCAARMKN
jgi:transposase